MTNTTTTTQAPESFSFLMRCTAKGCKTTFRVTLPGRLASKSTRGIPGVPGSATFFNVSEPIWPGLELHCVTHRRRLECRLINGKFSERHECDERCLSAKGHNCECSCGGANHGKNFQI